MADANALDAIATATSKEGFGMSNYYADAKNPLTGKIERALFIDDYFGKHRYGVQFENLAGWVYRLNEIEIPDREAPDVEKN